MSGGRGRAGRSGGRGRAGRHGRRLLSSGMPARRVVTADLVGGRCGVADGFRMRAFARGVRRRAVVVAAFAPTDRCLVLLGKQCIVEDAQRRLRVLLRHLAVQVALGVRR